MITRIITTRFKKLIIFLFLKIIIDIIYYSTNRLIVTEIKIYIK